MNISGCLHSKSCKHNGEHRDHNSRTGNNISTVGPHGTRARRNGSKVCAENRYTRITARPICALDNLDSEQYKNILLFTIRFILYNLT